MSEKNPIQSPPPPRWSLALPYWSATPQQLERRPPAGEKRRPLLARLRGERRARRVRKEAG